jgi:hypothetical protein
MAFLLLGGRRNQGAGTINKLKYSKLGTNEDTSMALDGSAVVISSDEEYEDVASVCVFYLLL